MINFFFHFEKVKQHFSKSMSLQFLEKSKSAGERLVSSVQRRIDDSIDEKFSHFKLKNDVKRAEFIVSVEKNFINVKYFKSHWKSLSNAFC